MSSTELEQDAKSTPEDLDVTKGVVEDDMDMSGLVDVELSEAEHEALQLRLRDTDMSMVNAIRKITIGFGDMPRRPSTESQASVAATAMQHSHLLLQPSTLLDPGLSAPSQLLAPHEEDTESVVSAPGLKPVPAGGPAQLSSDEARDALELAQKRIQQLEMELALRRASTSLSSPPSKQKRALLSSSRAVANATGGSAAPSAFASSAASSSALRVHPPPSYWSSVASSSASSSSAVAVPLAAVAVPESLATLSGATADGDEPLLIDPKQLDYSIDGVSVDLPLGDSSFSEPLSDGDTSDLVLVSAEHQEEGDEGVGTGWSGSRGPRGRSEAVSVGNRSEAEGIARVLAMAQAQAQAQHARNDSNPGASLSAVLASSSAAVGSDAGLGPGAPVAASHIEAGANGATPISASRSPTQSKLQHKLTTSSRAGFEHPRGRDRLGTWRPRGDGPMLAKVHITHTLETLHVSVECKDGDTRDDFMQRVKETLKKRSLTCPPGLELIRFDGAPLSHHIFMDNFADNETSLAFMPELILLRTTLYQKDLDSKVAVADLHECATHRNGVNEVAELLLDPRQLKNIDRVNKEGQTALYKACVFGRDETVEYLVTKGANPNKKNEDSDNLFPLIAACLHATIDGVHPDLSVATMSKSISRQPTSTSSTPSMLAGTASGSHSMAPRDSIKPQSDLAPPMGTAHERIVRYLLRKGAHAKQISKHGNRAMHACALTGNVSIAKILLEEEDERKANQLNAQNEDGKTPLFIAAERGHHEFVRMLLQHGASANLTNRDRQPPLLVASAIGREKVVRVLLEAHQPADINQCNKDGIFPLFAAAYQGRTYVVETLVELKADLLQHFKGETALHRAARGGHMRMLKCMLHADPTLVDTPDAGAEWTPLHHACHGASQLHQEYQESKEKAEGSNDVPTKKSKRKGDAANSVIEPEVDKDALAKLNKLYQTRQQHFLSLVTYLVEKAGASVEPQSKSAQKPYHLLVNLMSQAKLNSGLAIQEGTDNNPIRKYLYHQMFPMAEKDSLKLNNMIEFWEYVERELKGIRRAQDFAGFSSGVIPDTGPLKTGAFVRLLSELEHPFDVDAKGRHTRFDVRDSIRLDGVATSKAKPSFWTFVKASPTQLHGIIPHPIRVLLKTSDDLRQDWLCIRLQRKMNELLQRDPPVVCMGTPLELVTYGALPLTEHLGLVQVVENAKTLPTIQTEQARDKTKPDNFWTLSRVNTFAATAAASFVFLWVLGVRDRHFDNFLVRPDGALFNIDFGWWLGSRPRGDASAVPFTKYMVEVIAKAGPNGWMCFQGAFCEAVHRIQENYLEIFELIDKESPHVFRERVKDYITLTLFLSNSATQSTAETSKASKDEKEKPDINAAKKRAVAFVNRAVQPEEFFSTIVKNTVHSVKQRIKKRLFASTQPVKQRSYPNEAPVGERGDGALAVRASATKK